MAPSVEYPKKLFYKIQEVANIIGVEAYVLRYWETKFPMLSPEKDASDQRRYRQKEIDLLLRIRELLYDEKYTIAGAVEKLKEEVKSTRRETKVPEKAEPRMPSAPIMFDLPSAVDSGSGAFQPPAGLSEEQLESLRRVREELGLLKRELENWRDEVS